MKLFLDDSRETPEGWIRVYTVGDTLRMLGTCQVTHLSLDNDLGEGMLEGHTVLDRLEEWIHEDPTFPIPIITIHSANAGRTPSMRQVAAKLEKIRQSQ